MPKYQPKKKKKGTNLPIVKNPKTEVDFLNNIVHELKSFENNVNMYFMRMRHHIANMQGDLATLIKMKLEKEGDKNVGKSDRKNPKGDIERNKENK